MPILFTFQNESLENENENLVKLNALQACAESVFESKKLFQHVRHTHTKRSFQLVKYMKTL